MKVAVQPSIYCGACPACNLGAENACPSGGFVGLSGYGGGMSDEVVLPAEACHPLPSNIGLDIGALVEPLAVAWHAVDSSPIAEYTTKGPNCLVLGGGPIGLAVCQVLQARGANKVIMSEVSAKRQSFARQLGASNVMDPRQYDIVAASSQLCDGAGPDIVFDCAGVPQSLETACKAVKVRGSIVNVAIWENSVPFNPNWLVFREAKYSAVLGYQKKDYEGVIEALADGRLKPEKMITARIALDDLVEEGYGALQGEKEKHVKVLIDMSVGAEEV
jgi:2-desacetyl-2-hydroxyethyl bacteriochlorophyllide A dehydrogenase